MFIHCFSAAFFRLVGQLQLRRDLVCCFQVLTFLLKHSIWLSLNLLLVGIHKAEDAIPIDLVVIERFNLVPYNAHLPKLPQLMALRAKLSQALQLNRENAAKQVCTTQTVKGQH